MEDLASRYWNYGTPADGAAIAASNKRLYARSLRLGVDRLRTEKPHRTDKQAVVVWLASPSIRASAYMSEEAASLLRTTLRNKFGQVARDWATGTENERQQQLSNAIRLLSLERSRNLNLDMTSTHERRLWRRWFKKTQQR